MPALREVAAAALDVGAGVSPQGRRLVRDRFQGRSGQQAQSCRSAGGGGIQGGGRGHRQGRVEGQRERGGGGGRGRQGQGRQRQERQRQGRQGCGRRRRQAGGLQGQGRRQAGGEDGGGRCEEGCCVRLGQECVAGAYGLARQIRREKTDQKGCAQGNAPALSQV